MKVEDCRYIEKWDYLGWEDYNGFHDQSDWNSTLIVKINSISNQILAHSFRGYADTVIMNPKTVQLLGVYYDEATSKLMNSKYDLILDDSININIIFVCNKRNNTDPQFIATRNGETEDGIPEITIEHENNFSEEQVLEYKKSLNGYILIENYGEKMSPRKKVKKLKL